MPSLRRWCAVKFPRTYRWCCRRFHARNGLLDHLAQTYPFSRGYYIQVEKKLREAGDDATADEVFHMRRRRERKKATIPKDLPQQMVDAGLIERWPVLGTATAVWLWFLDFVMGYGVRTGRLVHLFILLWMLNTAVFLSEESVERPVAFVQHRADSPYWDAKKMPKKPSGDEKTNTKRAEENPWPSDGGMPDVGGDDRWNTGHAFFMAMRVQVPVLGLVAENDWSPATRPMGRVGLSYADFASVMMVLNLILIPLIIAGLTGHLKKNA